MPVYYRETVIDQPPNFAPSRGTDPKQIHQQQQQQQRLLLQPQLSVGSSVTGTTIVSPSESTYIFDPRGTQSESDGTASFGTWLSASHLGPTPQLTKAPPSQSSSFGANPSQRMSSDAVPKGQQQFSHAHHFPLEVHVPSAAGQSAGGADAPGEVSRRSERWSREEFYPSPENGRVPGAPFHKVTKEDYVIEQVVESTPKLVHTTRMVYPTQQRSREEHRLQAEQMPKQQPQQMPKQYYYQDQQQRHPQQQQQRHQLPQVPSKTTKAAQAVQQQEQQPLQSSQFQNVPQSQKPQNYAQQHQYVQQQVQFQQPQQPHEVPQHAIQLEQQQMGKQRQQTQGVQVRQTTQIVQIERQEQQQNKGQEQKNVQPWTQQQQQNKYFQYVQQQQPQQKEQLTGQKDALSQQSERKDRVVPGEQQQHQQPVGHREQAVQQRPTQQQYEQRQHQQKRETTMWEQQHVERAEETTTKQKQQTAQEKRMTERAEEGEGTGDAPPPQMQLAEAPEELIQRQKAVGGEGDGSESPERQQQQVHRRHVMVNSPWYRQHPDFEQQKCQDFRNYAEPLYVCSDLPTTDGTSYAYDDSQQKSPQKSFYYQQFQPQQRVHQYFSPSSIKWDSIYEDEFPDGQPPPFAHGPGSPYDYLLYHQKVNLDRRRAESEQRRRHHSPVPGAAEHGYKFGGMDYVDHVVFDPHSYVGEPFDERHSRRDLHTGPPRRRGDFYGLDYTTMLTGEEGVTQRERQNAAWTAEEAQNYHGYHALPPRKNFRLCGRYTADPDAPLNIAEAIGIDEFDSEYMVGNTLSNQRCMSDRQLTDEEKRTFALLYGPGGFKPDHVTIRPDPVPDEPPVFSTTIGPQKSRSAADISPAPQGYVNPMKVEGESWMLGRREEHGNYGLLASSGEQPPFVRPGRFPPHVPEWAKERQFSMTRGAKSVGRSLFAPSWAKVPQPQPPYWVKRTEGTKGIGAVQAAEQQQPMKGQSSEEEGQGEREVTGRQQMEAVQQRPQQSQQQQQRQPIESRQQQMGQQRTQEQIAVEKAQHLVEQPQQQQQQQQQQQWQRKNGTNVMQPQQAQQLQAVQQKTAQPQQLQTQQQKTTIITAETITTEQQDNQPAQEVGAVQKETNQTERAFYQHQQVRTNTSSGSKSANEDGTPKGAEVPTKWQQRQQPQQPAKQVQTVQQQFEQIPAQKQPFNQPGGMYYFYEKRADGGKQRGEHQQKSEVQSERRVVGMAQQQMSPEDESSGLENLMMPKLGQFPTLPEGCAGKKFTGTGQQQIMRSGGRNAAQQTPNEVQKGVGAVQQQSQQQKEQLPHFPTGRRWSQEPQEGDIFVDGHGRPVYYVREVELDPQTGEAVAREHWQLVEEYPQQKEEQQGQTAGNALNPNSVPDRQFGRQINAVKSTANGRMKE